MLLIRRSLRIASHSGRTVQALRVIPSSWVCFSSSSVKADHGLIRHDLHGVTTESSAFSEASEVDYGVEQLQTEASSAGLGQQMAPDQGSRPERSRTTQLIRWPQPAVEELLRVRKSLYSTLKGRCFRCVRLFTLGSDVTLADILEGIAQTAPVGRVLHIEWEKHAITHQYGQESAKCAFVLFDTHAAALDLFRLAKQQTFLVRGKRVFASIWRQVAFDTNFEREDASRVVYIRGPRYVEGFNEEDMRKVLMRHERLVQTVGPLGLDAEACITEALGRGEKSITWRFYSQEKQARPVLAILRQAFYKKLRIRVGRDPCWNEDLYPKDRTNSSTDRFLPMPAKKEFSWPSVRKDNHISRDKQPTKLVRKYFIASAEDHKHMPKEKGQIKHKQNSQQVEKPSISPTKDQELMPGKGGQPVHERDIELIEKLYGSPDVPLRLDERQEERIAAWTQITHLPKTNTQHDQENDSPEQAENAQSLPRGNSQTPSESKIKKSPDRNVSFEEFFDEVVLPDQHKHRAPNS